MLRRIITGTEIYYRSVHSSLTNNYRFGERKWSYTQCSYLAEYRTSFFGNQLCSLSHSEFEVVYQRSIESESNMSRFCSFQMLGRGRSLAFAHQFGVGVVCHLRIG